MGYLIFVETETYVTNFYKMHLATNKNNISVCVKELEITDDFLPIVTN